MSTPQCYATPPKPQMGLCGILVTIVVAAVIITIWIGLVKMCNKIPPVNPPNPTTNNITVAQGINSYPVSSSGQQFPTYTNLVAFEPPVYDNEGNAYDVYAVYEVDSSKDLTHWSAEAIITQWLSGATVTNTLSATETINLQETAYYQPNGALVFAFRSSTSNMLSVIPPIINYPNNGEPQKFFRIAMLPNE